MVRPNRLARQPGSLAKLRLMRNGHEQTVVVKLAERPRTEDDKTPLRNDFRRPAPSGNTRPASLGLSVRTLDAVTARRFGIPEHVGGVVVARVEPMSPRASQSTFPQGVRHAS